MFGLNANAIHQYLNACYGALGGLLLSAGCKESVPGVLECSASWIPVQYIAWLLLILTVLKFAMNFGRDGLTGILKVQPPVASATQTVTTPINVAGPTTVVEEVKTTVTTKPKSNIAQPKADLKQRGRN